jgi:hypothetical protein
MLDSDDVRAAIEAAMTQNIQFVNEAHWSLSPQHAAHGSIAFIVAEALRLTKSATRHIKDPKPPRIHVGSLESIKSLPKMLDQGRQRRLKHVTVMDKTVTRMQDERELILLTVVASYPERGDVEDTPSYCRWRNLVIEWARHRYGEHLAGVVEHVDERWKHIHVLVHKNGAPIHDLSDGLKAERQALETSRKKAPAIKARFEGFRRFQLDFWEKVGRACGLRQRSDTPRDRDSRDEAKKRQAAAIAAEAARKEILDRFLDHYLAATQFERISLDKLAPVFDLTEEQLHEAAFKYKLAKAGKTLGLPPRRS